MPLDNLNTALADTAKAIEELNNRPTNFTLEAKKSEEYVSSQAAALVGEETGAYVAGMVNQAAQASTMPPRWDRTLCSQKPTIRSWTRATGAASIVPWTCLLR